HPFVELRLRTHNNVVDLAAEGLDFAIRFGQGNWPATRNERLFDAPLTALCAPDIARRLTQPADLAHETLLRSYRTDEWLGWFDAAQLEPWTVNGPVFDSSRLMVEAAMQGVGIALAPACMFERELQLGLLARPLDIDVHAGGYWLTSLKSKPLTPAMTLFRDWITGEASASAASAAADAD
ncbi:LysR family transcriptional regulator, partial [Burkholderia multivorans]|nr:LysR family transcriptional regulator [Burkholderia multivorans]